MGFLEAITNNPSVNQIKIQQKLEEAGSKRLDKKIENLKDFENNEEIQKAAKEFSSLLILQMLKEMRKTVPESTLFGEKNFAKDVFMSMLDEKIADSIAQRESLGISQMILDFVEKRESYDETEPAQGKAEGASQEGYKASGSNNEMGEISGMYERVNRFKPIIEQVAEEIQLDPDLIKAVIARESSGNPEAVSKKGAKGLMQLMDSTAADVGVFNPKNPEENIRGGAIYLKKLLIKYAGDLPKALAAYNAGPGAVDVYNGIPPYPETQNYVDYVLKMQQTFRRGV